jgi:hypothetical protein
VRAEEVLDKDRRAAVLDGAKNTDCVMAGHLTNLVAQRDADRSNIDLMVEKKNCDDKEEPRVGVVRPAIDSGEKMIFVLLVDPTWCGFQQN